MPVPSKVDASLWQAHLDFVCPRKELLRADEVAAALGCKESTVLRHYDSGALIGHDINAATGKRQSLRYRRDGVILFLAARANYMPEDLRHKIYEVLSKQSPYEIAAIQQACGELIRRKA